MSDTVRRVAVLVVLAVVAAGGIALAQREPERTETARPARQPLDGPTVGSSRAVSTSWYCAEGTSSVDGRADETVIVGNLEPRPIDVTTTVMPSGDLEIKTQTVRLDAYEQRRIPIADLIRSPEPGVVVETLGGQAVVEHEVTGFDDVAVGPCSRTAGRSWYFPEGSTERGAEDWLALFNPFGTDAIVDLRLLSDEGVQAPETAQALVVPRRSRVSVALHELSLRQLQVAVDVQARAGRVVAERTSRFDGSDTRKGIALALGATAGAHEWRFPIGASADGAAQSVSVANFTDRTTRATVRLLLDGEQAVPPEDVAVPGSSVVRVDVGGRIAPDTGYAVAVRSDDSTPIVAGSFGAWATPAPVTGVATTGGQTTAATRWAFAVGRLDEDGEATLEALNVGDRPVTVQLYAYTAGDPDSPASAPAEAVAPGERAVFSLGARGIRPDQVLVVAADGPILVGRQVMGPGVSVAPGVPFEEGAP